MANERDALYTRLNQATAELDPPFAVVDLAAFDANAEALARHASGKPLRVATTSIRCRSLLARVLRRPGWYGVTAYTLREALWLVRAGITRDALVAYPTADRASLVELGTDPELAAAVTITVDSVAQLDFVDAVIPPSQRAAIQLCLDLDASWRPFDGKVHIGVRRSPVHSVEQARQLAAEISARPGFRLRGVMAYEAHIAGLGDAPPGKPLRGAAIRLMQRRSYRELVARRAAVVAAVQEHAELDFVNSGGTGSVAATAADPTVTEVTAGSGLFGPRLCDGYRAWRPEPAAFFALPVVRRPAPGMITVLGGGWVASGAAGPSRLPTPWLPTGLRLIRTEGAGEVQTPLVGPAADHLRPGDRVWFRHAKAGELCEHVNELYLIEGDQIVDVVATYRGEGQAFL
ncbi:MAG: alanine racemase [Actinobacteria bacterium]|nr:MAG: alanine racemase [Actinomycetota bacterium]